ncbi:MAG: cation transporter [Actinobacteria bacterium]|nr:cation transporter [Actinomycetota bacterium]
MASHEHSDHAHEHGSHTHGTVDASLLTTKRGIWAVKWSLVGLGVTALFQVAIVIYTGSVALLADTIHNFGDAATAIPLWIAFMLARRPATKRFTYGYGRVEDIAGIAVVLTILASAVVAAVQSIERLLNPQPMEHVWVVAAAAIIGFLGNEAVALFRIKVGREINSAALIADGYHARADGYTSLGVLAGAIGVALGFPLADPIAGLLITASILRIVWQSGKAVLTRVADGVDPEVVDEIVHELGHVPGVERVEDVRVRWTGHRLRAEAAVAVSAALNVGEGHTIAVEARHALLHALPYLSDATVHVDPSEQAGGAHHRVEEHEHGSLPSHGHQ